MMLFYASNSWAKSGSFLLVILTGEQHNLLNFHFYIFSSSLNTYIYMYCIYIFLLNTWGHESCAFEWHESHLGFILLCETKSVVQLWWMNKFSIVFWLYVEHVISNVKDIILLMSCQIDDSPCILYSDLENPCSCIHIPLIVHWCIVQYCSYYLCFRRVHWIKFWMAWEFVLCEGILLPIIIISSIIYLHK